MSETRADLASIASALDVATTAGTAISQVAASAGLSLDDAYAIQSLGIDLRLGRGERLTGLKLGFTSREKAEQMGVSDVILGVLTDAMQVADGGTLSLAGLIHPRIEPEIAFRLAPGVDAAALADPATDPLALVTHVAPAMEVIDSRFVSFAFSLEDVVADDTSACRYVVGPWRDLAEARAGLDLADLAVTLRVDEEEAATGSTAAILGDPLNALPAVRRLAAAHGQPVADGAILLAGAATAAVPLRPGTTVTTEVAGLGSVSLTALA